MSQSNSNTSVKRELTEEEIEDIQFYLEEGEKLLSDLTRSFDTYLNNPGDQENLKTAYRMAHTIKGNSGFLNLDDLVSVAHYLEDVLNSILKGELKFHPDMKPILQEGISTIKELFSQLGINHSAHLKDKNLLKRLESLKTLSFAGSNSSSSSSAESKGNPQTAEPSSFNTALFSVTENLLIVQARNRLFGVNRDSIIETRPKLSVSTIPLCDHFMSQIGNYNGHYIPVIDVPKIFKLEKGDDEDSNNVIFVLVSIFNQTYALKFEKIAGFLSIPGKEILPTNPKFKNDPNHFSLGIANRGDDPVDILDLKKLLSPPNSDIQENP